MYDRSEKPRSNECNARAMKLLACGWCWNFCRTRQSAAVERCSQMHSLGQMLADGGRRTDSSPRLDECGENGNECMAGRSARNSQLQMISTCFNYRPDLSTMQRKQNEKMKKKKATELPVLWHDMRAICPMHVVRFRKPFNSIAICRRSVDHWCSHHSHNNSSLCACARARTFFRV